MHPQAGGAEVRIHELGKRLVKSGCRVRLICERWPGSNESAVIDGIEIHRIGGRYDAHLRVPFLLKSEDYDVVIDDIAHAVPWFSPLFTQKPVIGQVHHVHGPILSFELPSALANIVSFAEGSLRFVYNNIVVVSESTKSALVTQYNFSPEHIKVVPNGVDLNFYRPSCKSKNPTVLWLGRVKRYKRVDHVLSAFKIVVKEIPNAQLLIVGEGDYLPALKRIRRQLGLSNVSFLGKVSEEEKVRLMGSSWVTVATSLVEGWCMSITESAACSSAAVAYNVAGLRDSVVDKKTGILIKDGDTIALADAIVELLNDEKFRNILSENAFVHSKCQSWENSADDLLTILKDLPPSDSTSFNNFHLKQFSDYAFDQINHRYALIKTILSHR